MPWGLVPVFFPAAKFPGLFKTTPRMAEFPFRGPPPGSLMIAGPEKIDELRLGKTQPKKSRRQKICRRSCFWPICAPSAARAGDEAQGASFKPIYTDEFRGVPTAVPQQLQERNSPFRSYATTIPTTRVGGREPAALSSGLEPVHGGRLRGWPLR